MRIYGRLILIILFLIIIPSSLKGQAAWYYQWGLLPDNTIDYFITESSGERAYNHIIELSEYNRIRKPWEFSDTLMESKYVTDNLKKYGLSDISIEKLGKTNVWFGQFG